MSDAETIAKGLTEAQRARILALTSNGRLGVPRGQGRMAADVMLTMPDLVTRWFRGDSYAYSLTPLGLAVRDLIGKQP
jgi:hypothetical protein